MTTNRERGFEHEPVEKIEQELLASLPELAREIISDQPADSNFKKNPDDVAEHEPKFHQFGIISHTEKASEAYSGEMQELLSQWGMSEKVNTALSVEIDGRTKAELFQLSIPLHDLGKFASPVKKTHTGDKRIHIGHEAKSEQIIRKSEKVQKLLQQHGLTEAQINYIATCVGLHYELGKMREQAKKTDLGYSLAFTDSDECKQACKEIAEKNPEFKIEAGLYFLPDSLAKTNIKIDAQTDEEIEAHTSEVSQKVAELGLDPKFVFGVKQLPINVAVARKYLESIE